MKNTILLLFAVLLLGASKPPTIYAPFVSTPNEIVNKMLNMAEVRTGDVFYDLGSGDGRAVIAAAKRGAKAIGIEINQPLAEKSQNAITAQHLDKLASIRLGDITDMSFSDATVVFLFLSNDANNMLRPKLQKLKTGARVVAFVYPVPGWKPDKREDDIYLWLVK